MLSDEAPAAIDRELASRRAAVEDKLVDEHRDRMDYR
jgi:hypothetical protein